MAILPILKFPDPRLRGKAETIENITDEIKQLAADMVETMYSAAGAGLAAPQIGRLIKLIVIDDAENDEEFGIKTKALINPEIIFSEGEQLFNEGCLSVIDLHSTVKRKQKVKVKAQDIEGNVFEIDAEGRKAVILQHEIDHLSGILFIDHLGQVKKDIYKRRLRKMNRKSVES